jgi:hypothetical protein
MAPRHRVHRFARVREHALSRLCAAWFIVLILVPFTAPFPTFHLTDTSGGHSHEALPKDLKDKTPDCKVAVTFDRSVGLPPSQFAARHEHARSTPLAPHASRCPVLRI